MLETNPARVIVWEAHGRGLYFSQLSQSNPNEVDFFGESGVRDRLKQIISSGQYVLLRQQGNLTYTFTSDGRLLQIADPNGNTLTFTNSSGLLTQVSNNFGKSIMIQYNGNHISSVTDPKNQSISYTYTNGDLTQVTYPDTQSLQYAYTNHLLTDKYDTNSNLVGHWAYDTSSGRVSSYYRYADQGVQQQRLDLFYNFTATPPTITVTRSTGAATYSTAVVDGMSVPVAVDGCGATCSGLHESRSYDNRLNLTSVTYTSGGHDLCHILRL